MENIQYKINNKKKKAPFLNFLPKISKKGLILPIWRKKTEVSIDAFFYEKKLKFPKKIVLGLILAIFFQLIGYPVPILAAKAVEEAAAQPVITANGAVLSETEVELMQENLVVIEHLPSTDELNFTDMSIRTITAYNSEPGQTDGSPCITANGFNVCEHGIEDTVAANFLKFGTKVRIPELFGDKIFIVRDRMNPRFPERVDVWMVNKIDAKNFGVKRVKVEAVLE
ncbi:hypothetical protein COU01_03625 [Candidatus Falkowbacteria bacterium CG10_big_fil_rev_8_21_14_0_10_44_15]|uniref:3D domain-containing protein n=1 Tax=Candidatus Falkowbacteria bacterium CG10_big_fil_rev_8_21_14_0_10_44_15 TaxID=1974569 RepID=A0A2H0UZ57_9BACT|nr:MAG: hypothetical protein COU01_03625 [Candidatus Falkowbacteria bacterium CG10_big_fil_rev_8_21_14_0_10_44_15]